VHVLLRELARPYPPESVMTKEEFGSLVDVSTSCVTMR
jgi:hypothetical protein